MKAPNPATFTEDWNTFYQDVPADDVPWELGGPSHELKQAIENGTFIPPARLLDIGCGLGSQTNYMAKSGFEVVGIDIAAVAIEKAQKLAQFARSEAVFKVADTTSLPFLTDSFDIMYDRGCFMHLKPAEQFRYRTEISRVLTDGGTFLLVVFAQAFTAKELENFFSPSFVLYEEEVYTTTEKDTFDTVTWRSLLFEKQTFLNGIVN